MDYDTSIICHLCQETYKRLDILTFKRYDAILLPVKERMTMTTATKRATIYMDLDLHRALRMKAAETSRSISEIVNDAVRLALAEDAEDLAAFKERANESLVSFEDVLKELRDNGRI